MGAGLLMCDDTLDLLILALCRDYFRRADAIERRVYSPRTLMEYSYINAKMKEAADEVVSDGTAEIYIEEIGTRCGYAYSKVDHISESTYKIRKKEIKDKIARKLHLKD